ARGALSRAHQGGRPGRHVPAGRLGHRDGAQQCRPGGPMRGGALLRFLRRELAPTPGRGAATFRLTLACVAATIPILTHRIPHALWVWGVMYLITQEAAAATLIGSFLAVIGVTVGLGLALLALRIALDVPPLRIACFAAFFFGGLFLKRVLTFGALGSVL